MTLIRAKHLFSTLFILICLNLYSDYPEIKQLKDNDFIFKQLTSDITASYSINASGGVNLPLLIYNYKPSEGETLFIISSRLNLPYESISTLNRISSISEFKIKDIIKIPNQPVLFIPVKPVTDIEFLLSSRNIDRNNEIVINSDILTAGKYHFIINGRFNNTERAFFLNTFFRFPLERGNISSNYGLRLSPITGEKAFHPGIDIAAPAGTPVFSSGQGVVIEESYSQILGNYIIIKHPGTYQTVYGHMKKSFVILGNSVKAGTIIGEVGNTGYSTGPHLHFEVRSREKAEDPLILIHRKQ